MKRLLQLPGIITVLNTPFDAAGQLDPEAVRCHAEYAIGAGVAGFLVPAMASEVGKLNINERESMVKAVLSVTNAAKQKVPVIGGASDDNPEVRLRLSRRWIELGCEGLLVSIPFTTEGAYLKQIDPLMKLDPPFLMIQDWSPAGFGIPLPLIIRLFKEYNAFKAIKIEVVPAGVKYSQVLKATEGKLHVSGGWAVMQMIEALDRGVQAFMPTGLHEVYTRIFTLYHQGQRDAAQALFRRILPILAFSNQHLDISIHFFKRLLYRQGIYPTPRVRPPILEFDPIHEKAADALINEAIQLMTEIREGKI